MQNSSEYIAVHKPLPRLPHETGPRSRPPPRQQLPGSDRSIYWTSGEFIDFQKKYARIRIVPGPQRLSPPSAAPQQSHSSPVPSQQPQSPHVSSVRKHQLLMRQRSPFSDAPPPPAAQPSAVRKPPGERQQRQNHRLPSSHAAVDAKRHDASDLAKAKMLLDSCIEKAHAFLDIDFTRELFLVKQLLANVPEQH